MGSAGCDRPRTSDGNPKPLLIADPVLRALRRRPPPSPQQTDRCVIVTRTSVTPSLWTLMAALSLILTVGSVISLSCHRMRRQPVLREFITASSRRIEPPAGARPGESRCVHALMFAETSIDEARVFGSTAPTRSMSARSTQSPRILNGARLLKGSGWCRQIAQSCASTLFVAIRPGTGLALRPHCQRAVSGYWEQLGAQSSQAQKSESIPRRGNGRSQAPGHQRIGALQAISR